MFHRATPFLILTGWLILGASLLAAQQVQVEISPEADEIFNKALEAYKIGQIEKAQDGFQRLVDQPLNQRSSASRLMLGKAFYRLGDFEGALYAAKNIELDFPSSRYIATARLLMGDSYYMMKRYFEAAEQYGKIIMGSAALGYKAKAAERLAPWSRTVPLTTRPSGGLDSKLEATVWRMPYSLARLVGTGDWAG